MVREFLEKLCADLAIASVPKLHENKFFALPFAPGIEVIFSDLHPGIAMRAILMECALENKEDLFIYLMRANLLGQGTGGARIGLEENEKNLTLSLGLPYEMNYQDFKERFEEFVNHLVYWRNVLTNLDNEKMMY